MSSQVEANSNSLAPIGQSSGACIDLAIGRGDGRSQGRGKHGDKSHQVSAQRSSQRTLLAYFLNSSDRTSAISAVCAIAELGGSGGHTFVYIRRFPFVALS
jgi:hypothetical protein